MEEEQYSNLYRTLASKEFSAEFEKDLQIFFSENEGSKRIRTSQQLSLVQHLPSLHIPLIGREQEVTTIGKLLQQTDIRLLTLTGPGGVGKSRLALQVAVDVFSIFTDGICFVSLANIDSSDLVLPTIAQALGLNERQDYSLMTQIQAVIRDKHILLLIDSFEHVTEAALQLKVLLAMCPHLKILLTSRTVLRLLEEREVSIPPLDLPNLAELPSSQELSRVTSVAFFVQRAQAARPDFALTSENAYAVAQICMRLDGLPLALELAAARMKLFSPQSLLARLGHRLSFLTSGSRDAPERQQTLRKTMEWSYWLLTKDEQRLFRHLSVFIGGFSLTAVECIDTSIDRHEEPLLDTITSLLNQSMLQRKPQVGEEEQRFIMLETIREYALECLQNSNEEKIIRQAHALYYLEQTISIQHKIREEEPPFWIEWIEREFDNLRAAFNWFITCKDAENALKICGALCAFWSQNPTSEGYRWVRQALECSSQSVTKITAETKAQAMQTAAMLGYYRGNWLQADELADESLQLFEDSGNTYGSARVLIIQGMGALLRGKYTLAHTIADKCLQLLQGTQYKLLFAEALLVLAYSFYFQGDAHQAYTLVKKGFTPGWQTSGELYAMMGTVHAQALFAKTQKNEAEVQAMYEEGMAITKATINTGVLLPIVKCLVSMGAIVALQRKYLWAVNLWGKAKALYKTRDAFCHLSPQEWLLTILGTNLFYSQVVGTVRSYLDEQTFVETWNEGETMSLEQLLGDPDSQVIGPPCHSNAEPVVVAYAEKLTPRERDVLRLLSQGMSSAQIAKELTISLVTVNSHVRTIYSKLGVSSRSAATRYAMEHQLV